MLFWATMARDWAGLVDRVSEHYLLRLLFVDGRIMRVLTCFIIGYCSRVELPSFISCLSGDQCSGNGICFTWLMVDSKLELCSLSPVKDMGENDILFIYNSSATIKLSIMLTIHQFIAV